MFLKNGGNQEMIDRKVLDVNNKVKIVGICDHCRTNLHSNGELYRISLRLPKAPLELLTKDPSYVLCKDCFYSISKGLERLVVEKEG